MDSEEPPNVRVACSGDIDEVVRLMHDAAAWMSAKGTPAWDVARIDRTFAETFVLRSELLVASCSDGIVGCCTLSAEDPEFWPDALKGEAAYLHKLAVRRTRLFLRPINPDGSSRLTHSSAPFAGRVYMLWRG